MAAPDGRHVPQNVEHMQLPSCIRGAKAIHNVCCPRSQPFPVACLRKSMSLIMRFRRSHLLSATGGRGEHAGTGWTGGVPPEQWLDAPGRKEVAALLGREIEGCILVGHGLAKDLKALQLRHPKCGVTEQCLYWFSVPRR